MKTSVNVFIIIYVLIQIYLIPQKGLIFNHSTNLCDRDMTDEYKDFIYTGTKCVLIKLSYLLLIYF